MKILTVGMGELARYVSRAVYEAGHEAYAFESLESYSETYAKDDCGILVVVRNQADLAKAIETVARLEIPPGKVAYVSCMFSPMRSSMTTDPVSYLNILGKLKETYGRLNFVSREKKRQWFVGSSEEFVPSIHWNVVGRPDDLELLPETYRKVNGPGNEDSWLAESYGYVGVDVDEKLGETYRALQFGCLVILPPEESAPLGASFQIVDPIEVEAYSNQNIQRLQHDQVISVLNKTPIGREFDEDIEALLSKFEAPVETVVKSSKPKQTRKSKQVAEE